MGYVNVLWNLYKMTRNTKKTRQEIVKLQEKKWRRMVRHAYDASPYYRQTFEAAGITAGNIDSLPLSAFPTIDKAGFMEHFDQLVTVPDLKQEELRAFDSQTSVSQKLFRGKYHVVHSSGSTGKPGYFIYDEAAWNQMLVGIIRGALWGMTAAQIGKLLLEGPRIVYIAATDGRYGGAMAVGDGVDGLNARQLFLDIKTPLEEWMEKIREFQPNMIIGYPSAIKILGELAHEGEVDLKVLRVVSCGEPLGASLRKYLEDTFQAKVVNFYGASESLALGAELTGEDGMYLFDDMNVIEVEEGAIYLTSLYNFAQPLIRYRISDRLSLREGERAEYPFTKVESVQGRSEDLLWFENRRGEREFLHPLAVEGFCVEGLLDYQFRRQDKNAFEMLAEISGEERKEVVRKEMLQKMGKILREKRLDEVEFRVRFVREILPDSVTGKKKLIVV
ncbi:MAG: phenylacetate--CoA ligase family protein [Hungatella sp.]|jgi:phenylacetate-CoA ligase|nr:phenylacetate--CoA ligase family protein [Hungatella sp.]MCI9636976.1 phenylacetate--CoA ligase family protein [Hungatella sp.]